MDARVSRSNDRAIERVQARRVRDRPAGSRVPDGTRNRTTGAGCTLIPFTDPATPAAFYPFYMTSSTSTGCMWSMGSDGIPNMISDFGRNQQYGWLLAQNYTTTGAGASFA